MSPVTQTTDRWVQNSDGSKTRRARPLEERAADAESEETTVATEETSDGLTRDELYERAQELDISGRSNMTKDELAAAIAEHESSS